MSTFSASENEPTGGEAIAAEAAAWLARRDRGFTAGEQDAYLDWLRADARHSLAVSRLEAAWHTLDQLQEWRPADGDRPNPDLLAVRPRRVLRRWFAPLAVAATFAVGFMVFSPLWKSYRNAEVTTAVVRLSEMRTLPDGTVVELNRGAEISIDFSGPERLVRLLQGEAHFTVAKMGPNRPFTVMAGNVRVRAVGTVFNVRMLSESVDVLVTEGKVRIDPPGSVDPGFPLVLNARMLDAGQRASVNLAEPSPAPPTVVDATPAEIEETLRWQGLRLVFRETPMADVIEQFNRHGSSTFVLADRDLASIRIEGNFRADNAEAFVRLLQEVFTVEATPDGHGRLVLRRGR
jgi:transmembrane sensor